MSILLALLLFFVPCLSLAQANYVKSAELPPLRVSFAALQAVLDKTEKLATSANGDVKPRREEVVLKTGTVQVTIPGHVLEPSNVKIPTQIDRLSYTYVGSEKALVTRINFDFSDYSRSISIEGSSPEHVDAVFATAREDLIDLSTSIGGSGIKILLGFPTYWVLIAIFGWCVIGWYSNRSRKSLAVGVATASLLALLLVLPTSELLAGFLAIRGEPSFMNRYGAEISFLGLLISVLGLPLAVIQLFATPKQRVSNHETAEH